MKTRPQTPWILVLLFAVSGLIGCSSSEKEEEARRLQKIKQEQNEKREADLKAGSIGTKIGEGIELQVINGFFSHDLKFTNESKINLESLEVTVQVRMLDGSDRSETRFWGTWKTGETWTIGMPPGKFQQVKLKGIGKLTKPEKDMTEFILNRTWNL